MAGRRFDFEATSFREFGEEGLLGLRPGQKRGNWLVGQYLGQDNLNKDRWSCTCDCGATHPVSGAHLRGGKSTSCGCARGRPRHGHTVNRSSTPEYETWRGMKERCQNPKSTTYPSYGGNGISICDRWQSFENFYADMGKRPNGHTLDRIDSAGNYEPSNCRWATVVQQNRNRSSNRYITANGKTMQLFEWAQELSVDPSTILSRIRRGYSEQEAVSSQKMRSGPKPKIK